MSNIVTLKEAKTLGLDRYFTGIPCKRGHISERAVIGYACLACRSTVGAERVAEWRTKNAEKARSAVRAWRDLNSEKERVYRASNKQRIAQRNNLYHAANKDRARSIRAKRRARKLSATPSWFSELDELVMIEAFDLAARRERVTGFAWHVDHMFPLQARTVCGLHVGANIQVIPAAMNLEKHNKLRLTKPLEWLHHV